MTKYIQSKSYISQIKDWLKGFPLIVKIKQKVWSLFDGSSGRIRPNLVHDQECIFPLCDGCSDTTRLNILHTFHLYLPYSTGNYKDRARLTLEAINQVFPFLSSLVRYVQNKEVVVEDIKRLSLDSQNKASAEALKQKLDRYGSDKANNHNYHHLYGAILCKPKNVENIFEIGLGTNNTDVVSNMGIHGKPGASLRAFRDHCPNAFVYGADLDKRVLFEEERIKTFFVDQTKPITFDSLLTKLPNNFDLVIDDGLHSPNANIASLEFGLKIVKVGGWVVIEDIVDKAISVWKIVSALLPDSYESHIFSANHAMVFAIKRLQ